MGWDIGRKAKELNKKNIRERSKIKTGSLKKIFIALLIYFSCISIFIVLNWQRIEYSFSTQYFFLIIFLAFIFEVLDSSAGMGSGTSLTPILLLLAYTPIQIVPAILISESITGFVDAYFGHEFENVHFFLRPITDSTKLALIIAVFGCIAIFSSILLTYWALQTPILFIKIYVTTLIIGMGIFSLFRSKLLKRTNVKIKPKLLIGFATLAGFNKGIGGGGFGPVVTLGQIESGIYEKTAPAIVSLSEAIISIVGVIAFILVDAVGVVIDLVILPLLFIGAFLGALVAPYLRRVLSIRVWQAVIPVYAIVIGILSLFFIFGFL